ncbi:alpha-L-rhamnosidase [Paenibacillus agaridevorans]|nr:alpha-L-rhamnosidase [Paenibacillus agaridevorans]
MIKVSSLTTEYANNPLGIDRSNPRLGWINESMRRGQRQSAYRILVSMIEENLDSGFGDVWDSGKCESGRCVCIDYAGEKLQSATRYYWKVCVWDEEDRISAWSPIAWWETGLLHPEDWSGAWLSSDGEHAPLFRSEFQVEKPLKQARLYISAAGYCEAYLNGGKVGDHKLEPAFTVYNKRNLYHVYDIGPQLLAGKNCVGIELGRGFYGLRTPNVWNWHRAEWNDSPRFIAQLVIQYMDGSDLLVKTDDRWELIEDGPTLSDSIFAGERYDARKYRTDWNKVDFCAADACKPKIVPPPSPRLEAQSMPSIRVVGHADAVKMTILGDGHYVFDMGDTIAGWVEATIRGGRPGQSVSFIYGEKLDETGRVDNRQTAIEAEIQTDHYLKSSWQAEKWEPKFSYKGFRYVEISGQGINMKLSDVTGKRVHTDLRSTGRFQCSNLLFNRIHEATRKTLLNNFHGIITDTPKYEKNGWLGDAQLIAETAAFQFDMALFWEKWLIDMRDSQRPDGSIPVMVPDSGWGDFHAPEWSSAYVLIAWRLYWYYDDMQVLQEHYGSLRRYIEYEIGLLDGGMSSSDLGDWLAPGYSEGRSPEGGQITSSFHLILVLRTMAGIAGLLGFSADSERYGELAEETAEALNRECLDRENGLYHTNQEAGYRQTSNILPLALSLVPSNVERQVEKRLLEDFERRMGGHADVGIIGHKYFYPTLTRLGYGEAAYRAATQIAYPSMGLWFEQEATTLWEYWDVNTRSRNHYMFGTIVQWFYEYIAGIRQTAAGWSEMEFKPHALGDLTSAEATLDTVKGTVHAAWSRTADISFELTVHVPMQSRAMVYVPILPAGQITENRLPADQACGIQYIKDENGFRVYEIEAGRYAFASR